MATTKTNPTRKRGNPGQRSFAPKGCSQTVLTTLRPNEFKALDDLAEKEARTRSATARLLLLMGMRQYEQEKRLQAC